MNFFVFERKVVHLDWGNQQRVEIWDRNRNQVMMPATFVHWSSYPRPRKQKRALQGHVYSIKVEAEKGLKVMREEPGENSGAISRSNRPWVAPQGSQLWDRRVRMSSPEHTASLTLLCSPQKARFVFEKIRLVPTDCLNSASSQFI